MTDTTTTGLRVLFMCHLHLNQLLTEIMSIHFELSWSVEKCFSDFILFMSGNAIHLKCLLTTLITSAHFSFSSVRMAISNYKILIVTILHICSMPISLVFFLSTKRTPFFCFYFADEQNYSFHWNVEIVLKQQLNYIWIAFQLKLCRIHKDTCTVHTIGLAQLSISKSTNWQDKIFFKQTTFRGGSLTPWNLCND